MAGVRDGAPWTGCGEASLERDMELLQGAHELPWGPPSGSEGLGGSAPQPAAKILRVIRIALSQLLRGVLLSEAKQLFHSRWVWLWCASSRCSPCPPLAGLQAAPRPSSPPGWGKGKLSLSLSTHSGR